MSEEEKQAIEMLEKFITEHKLFNIKSADNLENNIKILLNLIEKQQKEIEELKTITREYESYKCGEGNKIVIASKEYFINGFFEDFLNGYISKDKIREKIELLELKKAFSDEFTEEFYLSQIDLLKELLEE